MKVCLEFNTIDSDGDKTASKCLGVMEVRKNDYRIVYMEDLSGQGIMTKSTLIISKEGMRIIRKGELSSDFIYEEALVHNTTYKTPYGIFPVTISTSKYVYNDNIVDATSLPEDFFIGVVADYSLIIGQGEPMNMSIEINVKRWE